MTILDFQCQSSYWQINWQTYPLGGAASAKEWQFLISSVRVHIGRSSGRSTPREGHLVAKNGNFRFPLLEFILADLLAYLSLWERHLVAKNGNVRFLLLEFILADQLTDLPPNRHIQQQRMGILDFYCQFILADQQLQISTVNTYWQMNWQIYPPGRGIQWQRIAILDFYCQSSYCHIKWHICPPRGIQLQIWQFQISTVRVHIDRSTGITTPWEKHLVAKDGNFRFLL